VQEYESKGYKIVVFTNQAMIKSALMGKAATNFKAKMDSILKSAGVDAAVFAATQKDSNRKPEAGMWDHFTAKCNGNAKVDLARSFFVGDAAGRQFDISDSDKKFAEAVGLPFKTPEEVFGESKLLFSTVCVCDSGLLPAAGSFEFKYSCKHAKWLLGWVTGVVTHIC
jgi:bifunctional polynucleotide phosphatase/kinase